MSTRKALQEHAYNALNDCFTKHQDDVLEIEILPSLIEYNSGKDHSSIEAAILQDGLCIGIPKQMLILAYLQARDIFFKHRLRGEASSQAAYEATRVMLLYDPEHITAANSRKRRLLHLQKSAENDAFLRAVTTEKAFLDSILTSPLHRQSKSPTFWFHRAWLLNLVAPERNPAQGLEDHVLAELNAVCKSGERHPKNYYAWQYARRLFVKARQSHTSSGVSQEKLILTCAALVKAWCLKHPSDISGWSFLIYVVPSIPSVPQRAEIVQQVLEYAISLRWPGQSLWNFIRTVLAGSALQDERAPLIQEVHDYASKTASEHCARHAAKWIDVHKSSLRAEPGSHGLSNG